MNERSGERRTSEFQSAVDRLERAVQDLAASAKNEFADRAATLIDETSSRIERELGGRRDDSGEAPSRRSREERSSRSSSSRRSRRRHRMRGPRVRMPSRHLYRDKDNARICGVCAGLANYFGVEPWVVRCGAITGLLFLPGIVFPAYWVMYFVMDEPPKGDAPARDEGRRSNDDDRYTSPAPELGPRLSPRGSLRNVQADLQEAELKLRRLETHVTSGQYELQKELNKLEHEGRSARP